jgi:flavodoxin I
MKALIVYDSFFGNTEQIARAMADSIGSAEDVKAIRVADYTPGLLSGLKFLCVGSPTRGFRPSPAMAVFLKQLPESGLKDMRVAAFDTRIATSDIKVRLLGLMVNLFGYAAKPIANQLVKKGGIMVVAPEGFCVKDSKGPLKEGELQRAGEWAKRAIGTP